MAWPSATHLVAHLLREIVSAVQSVLEPADVGGRGQPDGHRAKIRAILTELGISHDDLVAEFWLGFAGQDNSDNLATRAHRSALEPPRPFDEEFTTYVDKVEQVLDVVLERFEISYFEIFERLDELLATPTPSDAHANMLRQRFPHSEAVAQHFFSKASAAWIMPLYRADFFGAPPSEQIDEVAGTVQFPAWPASQFLVRVADQAPEEVQRAALSIPSTNNSRINHDLIEIATALPADMGAALVPSVNSALASRFGLLIPQRTGTLLAHLCRGGQIEPALNLLTALLKALSAGYRPAATLHGHAYGVILREHVPGLRSAAGMQILPLLCQALDEVVCTRGQAWGDSAEDGSPLWRPNIEGQGSRSEADLRHALVDAVRDAASSIVESDRGDIGEVVAELDSHPRVIFQRIALHLLSSSPAEADELPAERLTDAVICSDWRLEREYLLLARSYAPHLSPAYLRRLLNLIDRGPLPAGHFSDESQPQAQDPQVRERLARWQRNRLAAIQAVLPREWDARYQALVAEFGDAPDPAARIPEPFAIRTVEAPVTAGELEAMPTDVLVAALKTGRLPGQSDQIISPDSLRSVLSSAIQSDAEQRSADAGSFIGLPAEYADAVINGLWQASANGAALDWDGVVGLSLWLNEQAQRELAHGGTGFRRWREPRLGMLRLLMTGLNLEPNPISADHDTAIWAIIEDCCRDSDPTVEQEEERTAGPDDGLMTLALTTVRPQAIRATITHGLRLRRRSPNADLNKVCAILDRHLDCQLDPSCAVRSIYGELFSQLVWMDKAWADRQLGNIFPTEPGSDALLHAAWDTYLLAGRTTETTWPLLIGVYRFMTDSMGQSSSSRSETYTETQLGRHLLSRLWAGRLDLDSHDGLLRDYYTKASPEVAAQLMWWITRDLSDLATPDAALIARMMAFWEYRVAAVKRGADASELPEFGHWFASSHFDALWSLQQLLTALALAPRIEAEDAMLSRLANLADEYTQPCLAVLERWVNMTANHWLLSQSVNSIRQVLDIGMTASPTAVQTSKRIISLLARDHGIDLRDVARGGTPPD